VLSRIFLDLRPKSRKDLAIKEMKDIEKISFYHTVLRLEKEQEQRIMDEAGVM